MAYRDELQAFLVHVRHECGLAENSVRAYQRDLRRFLDWVGDTPRSDWSQLSIGQLDAYLQFLHGEQLAPSTIARHVASLRMFFRFLVLEGRIPHSTAEMLQRPGLWERIPYVMSERQVAALLDSPQRAETFYWRDRAILAMMYATGTRASEVAGLRMDRLYLEERYCRCIGKGNKERLVPFSPSASEALQMYLERQRPALLGRHADPGTVFLTRSGKPLTRIFVWKLVKKYARRVGIGDRVSPHTLRHSFATHLLGNGADLRVIQEFMGHCSITTTQHYARVDASRLKAIHQRFHPRG